MRWRTNYFEIQDMVIQFANAFDSIVIGRYNKNRKEKDRIFVRYLYAPKQRVLYDIVNKAKTITFPVVTVNIANIARDNNRVFNKLPSIGGGSYAETAGNGFYYGNEFSSNKFNAPTPVNIQMNMSIITRYQMDMDQILSNFIPYNNPYIVISWPLPLSLAQTTKTHELRSEVLWDGNINISYPTELRANDKARVIADTAFTIKGWIFPAAENNVDNIYKITSNFYAVSGTEGTGTNLSYSNYPTLNSQLSGATDSTDTIVISAFPDEIEIFREIQSQ
tara:strand:+ start:3696 stop:4529 length:834 start_codon:yes stop_codon:yes gene_type:complete